MQVNSFSPDERDFWGELFCAGVVNRRIGCSHPGTSVRDRCSSEYCRDLHFCCPTYLACCQELHLRLPMGSLFLQVTIVPLSLRPLSSPRFLLQPSGSLLHMSLSPWVLANILLTRSSSSLVSDRSSILSFVFTSSSTLALSGGTAVLNCARQGRLATLFLVKSLISSLQAGLGLVERGISPGWYVLAVPNPGSCAMSLSENFPVLHLMTLEAWAVQHSLLAPSCRPRLLGGGSYGCHTLGFLSEHPSTWLRLDHLERSLFQAVDDRAGLWLGQNRPLPNPMFVKIVHDSVRFDDLNADALRKITLRRRSPL